MTSRLQSRRILIHISHHRSVFTFPCPLYVVQLVMLGEFSVQLNITFNGMFSVIRTKMQRNNKIFALERPKSMFLLTEFNLKLVLEPEMPLEMPLVEPVVHWSFLSWNWVEIEYLGKKLRLADTFYSKGVCSSLRRFWHLKWQVNYHLSSMSRHKYTSAGVDSII